MGVPRWGVGQSSDAFLLLNENLTVAPDSLRGGPIEELGGIGLKLLPSNSLNLSVHHGGYNLLSKVSFEIFMLTFVVAFKPVVADDV